MSRIAAAVVLAALPSLTLAMPQNKELPPPAAGIWHLLDKAADEQNIPDHRVDIRLSPSPEPFRAAIVNRSTGDDIPYAVAVFNGRVLTLQMGTHGGPPMPGTPMLRMTWDGTRFEGGYVDAAFQPLPKAQPLKLIRSGQ